MYPLEIDPLESGSIYQKNADIFWSDFLDHFGYYSIYNIKAIICANPREFLLRLEKNFLKKIINEFKLNNNWDEAFFGIQLNRLIEETFAINKKVLRLEKIDKTKYKDSEVLNFIASVKTLNKVLKEPIFDDLVVLSKIFNEQMGLRFFLHDYTNCILYKERVLIIDYPFSEEVVLLFKSFIEKKENTFKKIVTMPTQLRYYVASKVGAINGNLLGGDIVLPSVVCDFEGVHDTKRKNYQFYNLLNKQITFSNELLKPAIYTHKSSGYLKNLISLQLTQCNLMKLEGVDIFEQELYWFVKLLEYYHHKKINTELYLGFAGWVGITPLAESERQLGIDDNYLPSKYIIYDMIIDHLSRLN